LHPKAPKRGEESPTDKFLICLTRELKQKIKSEAHKMFGKRKGAESMYVELVMREHLHMNVEGVQET
jgi:hypothetical protein